MPLPPRHAPAIVALSLASLCVACSEGAEAGAGGGGASSTSNTTSATGAGGAGGTASGIDGGAGATGGAAPGGAGPGAGGTGGVAAGGAGTGGGSGGSGPAGCQVGGSTNLPGATITFPEQPCTFTLAEAQMGISIAYEVVIEQSLAGVVPLPPDAGQCAQPGDSRLIVFEHLSGGNQSYCLCDIGFCMGPDLTPVSLVAGSYAGAFVWDGVNWFGPSDYGNPKGAPFPPGTYVLTVSAEGTWSTAGVDQPFEVEGTFAITLVP